MEDRLSICLVKKEIIFIRTKPGYLQSCLKGREQLLGVFGCTRRKRVLQTVVVHKVQKGYAQKEGVDYYEVFSPVVKHTSIWGLLSIVAQFDWELEQLDIKTVVPHGDLEEEIFMIHEGKQVAGKENLVCKLQKCLYGLKQSPRQWYKRFVHLGTRVYKEWVWQ